MPNYYLSRDGELVEEGDARAAFLAYAEGTEPDDASLESIKKGLADEVRAKRQGKAAAPAPETKQVEPAEAEDKSASAPARRRQ